jgi:hypothetical protein
MNQHPDHQGGARAGEVSDRDLPPHTARPALPLTIEGPKEQVGEEIAELSPEGKPADAKVGPGLLVMEIALAAVIFAAVAIGVGLWLGWPAGVVLFVIAMMGLAFNPAAIAAFLRMKERGKVANRHRPGEAPVKVVRPADIDRGAV